MAVTCSIPDCQNNSTNAMLFQIPLEDKYILRKKWLFLIKRSYPYFSLTDNCRQYVCSKHFKDQHFILPDKLFLKSFAIPTVFDNDVSYRVDICELKKYGPLKVPPVNNTATDMNTDYGISAFADNNVDTNAVESINVISVPSPYFNAIKRRFLTRDICNYTSPIEHVELQES